MRCQQIEHEERRTLGEAPGEGVEHIDGFGEGAEKEAESGWSQHNNQGEQ